MSKISSSPGNKPGVQLQLAQPGTFLATPHRPTRSDLTWLRLLQARLRGHAGPLPTSGHPVCLKPQVGEPESETQQQPGGGGGGGERPPPGVCHLDQEDKEEEENRAEEEAGEDHQYLLSSQVDIS